MTNDLEETIEDLKIQFLDEQKMLISHIEQCQIGFDQDSTKSIGCMMRIVHTMKGEAQALGLEKLGLLAHQFEEFLAKIPSESSEEQLKKVKIRISRGIELYRKVIERRDEYDPSEIEQQLEQVFYQEDRASENSAAIPTSNHPVTKSELKQDSDDWGMDQSPTDLASGEGTAWVVFDDNESKVTVDLKNDSNSKVPEDYTTNDGARIFQSGEIPPEPVPLKMGLSAEGKYLLVALDNQHYALAVECVREIIAIRPCKGLPVPKPDLSGVIIVRGRVVPIVNLERLLHMAQKSSENGCIVICEIRENMFGLETDAVKQVISIADSDFQKLSSGSAKAAAKDKVSITTHISRINSESILLLDLTSLVAA